MLSRKICIHINNTIKSDITDNSNICDGDAFEGLNKLRNIIFNIRIDQVQKVTGYCILVCYWICFVSHTDLCERECVSLQTSAPSKID